MPGPLNGKTTLADLHGLLQAAEIEPPYVLLGSEPAIPMTYLLAMPSGWTGPPAYEAVVLDHIAKYVDRFSPGVLVEVESPHHMEAAVPERIAQELEKVIAKA